MKIKKTGIQQVMAELMESNLDPQVIQPCSNDREFSAVTADTRKLHGSSIFCAIEGTKTDGHRLLPAAADVTSLLLVEKTPDMAIKDGVAVVKVRSTRAAWAQLASFFADHPSRQLTMIAVTGTNGKTSTVWLLKEILSALGVNAGSIGTLGFYAKDEHFESPHTTPDPDLLYPTLASFMTKGITHVVMEVSSHSLAQGKVWPISFDGCAFTSFTQDHLDFHPSMDAYLEAKLSLFSLHLKESGLALVHTDILRSWPAAKAAFKALPQGFKTYENTDQSADFFVESESFLTAGFSKVKIQEKGPPPSEFLVPMIGDVFCENFAAATILSAHILQTTLAAMSERLANASLRPVRGRLELVSAQHKPCRPLVFIDYAHTPDALERSILNLSKHAKSVTTVFGCGGDRDKAKRPIMGEIGARLSKKIIVTSDNPRTEDPRQIIDDVVSGISDRSETTLEPDRRQAISLAIRDGRAQESVLIAGKGHEDYQIIGTKKIPFSDQVEAYKALDEAKSWLIVGAGVTGFAAASLLAEAAEKSYITADTTFDLPQHLQGKATPVRPEDIVWSQIDRLVVSPGIAPDHPLVRKAKDERKDILTEIDLGLDRYRGSLLAVTGTNGKSTTVAMSEYILRSFGIQADACGNIGIPPSSIPLWKKDGQHCAVIELSSYQLECSRAWPAKGAAITSFSNDHLARHKTMANYFAAKWQVTEWLNKQSVFVVSAEVAQHALTFKSKWPSCRTIVICNDLKTTERLAALLPKCCEMASIVDGTAQLGTLTLNLSQTGMTGAHNHLNAFVAIILTAQVTNLPIGQIAPILRHYSGLPYRCEQVYRDEQRIIINDSKSTNLESTMAALSIARRPAILLMGGQGKGEAYHDLATKKDQIEILITFGASGKDIKNQAPPETRSEHFEKMAAAVSRALDLSEKQGLDIIFSPGCASFDEFKNFEHRGAVFTQMVKDHLKLEASDGYLIRNES